MRCICVFECGVSVCLNAVSVAATGSVQGRVCVDASEHP